MAAKKKRSFDIILGSFVAIGLLVLVGLVFLIGKERRLFDSSVLIKAHFPNVAGLAVGADVLLSGVVVGNVKAIKFPPLDKAQESSKDVTVVMAISERSMAWIREDSIARVDSKGLLGDKVINLSIGSADQAQVQADGMLQSVPPVDFGKSMQKAQEILENVSEAVVDAKGLLKGFVDQGGDAALASSAKSIQRMLQEVEKGQGVIHELVYSKEAGKDTGESIKSLRLALDKIAKVADDISKVTAEVKQGHGLLHALVYDKAGAQTISNLNQGLVELGGILKEIKDGDGIVHDLIYAKDKGQFLRSLNSAAHDLELMVADVKSGKGTLGLLLRDPSLYNQLYALIGNLRRNLLLKAVIRHGISQPPSSDAK